MTHHACFIQWRYSWRLELLPLAQVLLACLPCLASAYWKSCQSRKLAASFWAIIRALLRHSHRSAFSYSPSWAADPHSQIVKQQLQKVGSLSVALHASCLAKLWLLTAPKLLPAAGTKNSWTESQPRLSCSASKNRSRCPLNTR